MTRDKCTESNKPKKRIAHNNKQPVRKHPIVPKRFTPPVRLLVGKQYKNFSEEMKKRYFSIDKNTWDAPSEFNTGYCHLLHLPLELLFRIIDLIPRRTDFLALSSICHDMLAVTNHLLANEYSDQCVTYEEYSYRLSTVYIYDHDVEAFMSIIEPLETYEEMRECATNDPKQNLLRLLMRRLHYCKRLVIVARTKLGDRSKNLDRHSVVKQISKVKIVVELYRQEFAPEDQFLGAIFRTVTAIQILKLNINTVAFRKFMDLFDNLEIIRISSDYNSNNKDFVYLIDPEFNFCCGPDDLEWEDKLELDKGSSIKPSTSANQVACIKPFRYIEVDRCDHLLTLVDIPTERLGLRCSSFMNSYQDSWDHSIGYYEYNLSNLNHLLQYIRQNLDHLQNVTFNSTLMMLKHMKRILKACLPRRVPVIIRSITTVRQRTVMKNLSKEYKSILLFGDRSDLTLSLLCQAELAQTNKRMVRLYGIPYDEDYDYRIKEIMKTNASCYNF